MLDPPEAFFFDSRNKLAVFYQASGRVRVKRIEAQDNHVGPRHHVRLRCLLSDRFALSQPESTALWQPRSPPAQSGCEEKLDRGGPSFKQPVDRKCIDQRRSDDA